VILTGRNGEGFAAEGEFATLVRRRVATAPRAEGAQADGRDFPKGESRTARRRRRRQHPHPPRGGRRRLGDGRLPLRFSSPIARPGRTFHHGGGDSRACRRRSVQGD
jgi:hypothetical protein